MTNSFGVSFHCRGNADIDAASLMADGRGADGSDLSATLSVWCNWSDDPEILQILLREFKGIGARVIGDSVSNDTETSVPGAAASVAKGKEREEAAGNEGAEGVAGASVGNEGQGVAAEGARDRSDLHMHLSEVRLGCCRWGVVSKCMCPGAVYAFGRGSHMRAEYAVNTLAHTRVWHKEASLLN